MRLRNRLHIGLQHISLFLFFLLKEERHITKRKKKKKEKKEGKKKQKRKKKGTIHIGKKQYTRKYCCTQ